MIEAHQEILRSIKGAMLESLSVLVDSALREAVGNIDLEQRKSRQSQKLHELKPAVLERFAARLGNSFDKLSGDLSEAPPPNYGSLSLMSEDELETTIALEGMIAHARNCDITEYLRFTTRLNSLYYTNLVDETNNPLDPAQIGEAFKQAVQPVSLDPDVLLVVYRAFNRQVFHKLESVLCQGNELLSNKGVIPALKIDGRDRNEIRNKRINPRVKSDPNERAFRIVTPTATGNAGQSDTVFALLQSLVHEDIQTIASASASATIDSIRIAELMYRAIDDDITVPECSRNLLVRTGLTMLRIVAQDRQFWNDGSHPARLILDEVARARLQLTRFQALEEDPVFLRAKALIMELVDEPSGSRPAMESRLEAYLNDRKQLLASHEERSETAVTGVAEPSQKRLEAARAYVTHRVMERMAGSDVPAVVKQFLEGHFRNFLVEVLLAHGPGSNNWTTVINTLDMLLWSVRPGKNTDDRAVLAQVNKRLMSNLGRAMRVAGVERRARGVILRQLEAAQQESFETDVTQMGPGAVEPELPNQQVAQMDSDADPELACDDVYWQEVNSYPIGLWMDFDVDAEHTIRCTLAARIEHIDQLVFVNRQGVRVVSKTRAGLAQEIRDGTARVIYESPLIDRAIDTVIARLRSRKNAMA